MALPPPGPLPSGPRPAAHPGLSAFEDDPLAWLLAASRRGPAAVVSRSGPVLSRDPAAGGTAAVFGPDNVARVLSDMDTFRMPVPVSTRLQLPPPLRNLNNALFSMTGSAHRSRQQLLARLLGPGFASEQEAAIDRGIAAWAAGRQPGGDLCVIQEMRRLARLVAEEVLFGVTDDETGLGLAVQSYFELRRHYAARGGGTGGEEGLEALVAQGMTVDRLLRDRVAALSQPSFRGRFSVVGELARQAGGAGLELSQDELVAHANILFMSSSEPIATAMTWLLLALVSRPELVSEIRLEAGCGTGPALPLLAGTIREVLRLVPPSAILVRVAGRGVNLDGLDVPAGWEVILCPFAEHRHPESFPEPDRFWPGRWSGSPPGAFQFLPFGGGARACLGRRIALTTVERSARALVQDADLVLATPQRLDWRMNLTLLPSSEPVLRLVPPGGSPTPRHALTGPVADLLR